MGTVPGGLDLSAMDKTDIGEAYYQTDRANMLRFMPTDAHRVLELGCGEGGFAALVKRGRHAREYWAIEYEPDVAAKAALIVDRLLIGDVDAHIDEIGRASCRERVSCCV